MNNLAKKYGKDVGQVILRFEHQEGVIVFSKSVHEARIKSNQEIFDFELTSDEMDAIRALDKGKGMHDPDAPGVAKAYSAPLTCTQMIENFENEPAVKSCKLVFIVII